MAKNLSIDFAFEGFRIVGRKPLLIPLWGLVLLLGNIVSYAISFAMMLPVMSRMSTNPAVTDPSQAMGLAGQLIGPELLLFVFICFFYAFVNCAIYRLVLGRPDTGFGYLRIGGDEIRNAALTLVYMILLLVLYIVLAIGGVVVGGILSLVMGAISKSLIPLAIVLTVILGVGFFFWFLVRSSLFAVQSFDQKKFNLFGTWSLTGGRAWLLFAGFFIIFVIAIVIELVCIMVFFGSMIGAGAAAMHGTANPNPAQLATTMMTMGPMMIIFILVFSLIVSPFMVALISGATAAAYKQLAGVTTMGAEKVF